MGTIRRGSRAAGAGRRRRRALSSAGSRGGAGAHPSGRPSSTAARPRGSSTSWFSFRLGVLTAKGRHLLPPIMGRRRTDFNATQLSSDALSLRVCLVTPFAWSQPHDVNEHVAGLASGLRELGHDVTVLAPSNRARDLAEGRRALLDGAGGELIALGPALPISRRSRMGVPVGARANLALALAAGRFDVVHGFEPGLPSLSYLALRDAQALTVATFHSPERLAYPPGRAQRLRLLARVDVLLATGEATARAAALRFPGSYRVVSPGVDPSLFEPARKQKRIVLEWRPSERVLLRSLVRELAELPEWELVVLRTKPLVGRPAAPRALRGRFHVRTARDGAARATLFAETAIVVPALEGLPRLALEASAAGAAVAAPAGMAEQPELAAAETARLAEDDAFRERRAADGRTLAEQQSFAAVAGE